MSKDPPPTVDLSGSPEGLRQTQELAAKLVVVSGPDEGQECMLDRDVTVGSGPDCDLQLHDPSVSRQHASFTQAPHGVKVKDLGSRNGTFVDGTSIQEADVRLGSVIMLGRSAVAVQPRWHVREVAPSNARRFGDLVGESLAMREVFSVLERIAPSDITVLVEGESGTGKELACRSLHQASARSDKPYVVFDCSVVARDIVESELFGHKKGAFTGAVADREGAFERADGGTIFLDEIGEFPLDLQPKLLRVLESGEIRRVGDTNIHTVDVRVLAATNRDLRAEARVGRFRPDLLYRLEVVRVRMPPLRARPEDIPQLIHHFLKSHLHPDDEIKGDNLHNLMAYSWPGNIRELRNTLDRAVALLGDEKPEFATLSINLGEAPSAPHTIGMAFPGVVTPLPYKEAKRQVLARFERAYVEALLARHENNISKSAEAAELSRKHLYELMRRSIGPTDGTESKGDE